MYATTWLGALDAFADHLADQHAELDAGHRVAVSPFQPPDRAAPLPTRLWPLAEALFLEARELERRSQRGTPSPGVTAQPRRLQSTARPARHAA